MTSPMQAALASRQILLAPPSRVPLAVDETDGADAIAELCRAARAHPLDALHAIARVDVRQRDGLKVGTVVALCGGFAIRISADAGRRAAVRMSSIGRKGAALDLLRVCDEAEALAVGAEGGAP